MYLLFLLTISRGVLGDYGVEKISGFDYLITFSTGLTGDVLGGLFISKTLSYGRENKLEDFLLTGVSQGMFNGFLSFAVL